MKFSAALLALNISVASAAEVDVYLLGGQSNMQGLGKIQELTKSQKQLPSNIYFWNSQAFEPMVVGKTKLSDRRAEFGPELNFAKTISEGSKPVYIIKFSASGMPLHHGWNGNNWQGGEPTIGRVNFYPGKNATDLNKGAIYKQMSAKFVAGIEDLKKQGHTPVVRGFVWMQGEQDSKNEVSAKSYAASLKNLKRRVAEDTGADDLAMSFGQVLPYEDAAARFTHRHEIREQMKSADMSSGKPENIFKTRMVPTEGFPLKADTVHYNTKGQLLLGAALANALKEAQSAGEKLYLYPNGKVPQFPDGFEHKKKNQLDPDRITETSNPYMSVYLSDSKVNTKKAMLIFPGGGYSVLSEKKEGDSVAAYFASQGINCFVVNYRVSNKSRSAERDTNSLGQCSTPEKL